MRSILTKIKAVELIASHEGRQTAGVDGLKFIAVPGKAKNEEQAIRVLAKVIYRAKEIISIAKGKTDQTIARKSKENLTTREKYRIYLKTPEGKRIVKKQKTILKKIEANPVEYLDRLIININEHNLKLKFLCLKTLKNQKLKEFQSKNVLRVLMPKDNGKLRPLGIPSIIDRTVQMLLKLVMEPYLEPLGDHCSYGFRPGRNGFQAIVALYGLLKWSRHKGDEKEIIPFTKRTLSLCSPCELKKYIKKGSYYYERNQK